MKLSVSLSEEDLAALDRHVSQAGLGSRSAGIQDAIRRLPDRGLQDAYAEAWEEWQASDDGAHWENLVPDGLTDAAR
ncbi:MAG: ribbon-helix-helix protein, CopG family [Propionibacterium sp.]|nr:ribbon-helix-helix protein, CopG family [Propionibacterium sp.]